MKPIITVEGVSKRYTIGRKESYGSLRDEVMDTLYSPFRRLFGGGESAPDPSVWALKDVSFEVFEGDVLGIIGRNGAGKSTLLKILSRITEPTEGRIEMRGRIASLLEVGTGFHPELTGRENIFMNGALLGMSSREIKAKFDEIVAFSEIEKFLDTPVKRYSSGMYVRLAFAVAAHLEPEILIIDEVLAVGDSAFQKKCLGKMGEVAKGGRTVLFVSHNMAAVENLCSRGVVLEKGRIVDAGKTAAAIEYYHKSFMKNEEQDVALRNERQGEGNVRITKITFNTRFGENAQSPIGAELSIDLSYEASADIKTPRVIIGVYDLMNTGITRFDTDIGMGLPASIPKAGRISCSTEALNLVPGRYYINIAFFSNMVMEDYLVGAAFFEVIDSDYFGNGKSFNSDDSKLIKVLFKHKWSVDAAS